MVHAPHCLTSFLAVLALLASSIQAQLPRESAPAVLRVSSQVAGNDRVDARLLGPIMAQTGPVIPGQSGYEISLTHINQEQPAKQDVDRVQEATIVSPVPMDTVFPSFGCCSRDVGHCCGHRESHHCSVRSSWSKGCCATHEFGCGHDHSGVRAGCCGDSFSACGNHGPGRPQCANSGRHRANCWGGSCDRSALSMDDTFESDLERHRQLVNGHLSALLGPEPDHLILRTTIRVQHSR